MFELQVFLPNRPEPTDLDGLMDFFHEEGTGPEHLVLDTPEKRTVIVEVD